MIKHFKNLHRRKVHVKIRMFWCVCSVCIHQLNDLKTFLSKKYKMTYVMTKA